jgi:hypothetical protein
MKNILLIIVLIISLISCEKDPLSSYTDGGVLPNATDNHITLKGTTWVLTHFTKGFVSASPNDTIVFNSYNTYTLNGRENPEAYKYMIVKTGEIGNPANLQLYGFSPFGNNGCWGTTLPNTFVDDGEIILSEFKSAYGNNSSIVKANFIRIE